MRTFAAAVMASRLGHEEVGVARNVKQNRANDSEIGSDEEIWKSIRYLDPDIELKRSDVVFGAAWILLFLLLCLFIFLFSHWA
jgi:hypothetical protein